jgi:probable rRNA maturation factor
MTMLMIMIIFRKRVPGVSEATLERFLRKTINAVGLHGTVNVLLTTSRELQSLNSLFRGKDNPTDVLSFAPISNLPEDFSGDIAISADIAARNARLLGHSAADEVKVLILHGVLHLAGHDHERDNGSMARKEQQLRRRFNLPAALIERTTHARAGAGDSAARQRRVARARISSAGPKRRKR